MEPFPAWNLLRGRNVSGSSLSLRVQAHFFGTPAAARQMGSPPSDGRRLRTNPVDHRQIFKHGGGGGGIRTSSSGRFAGGLPQRRTHQQRAESCGVFRSGIVARPIHTQVNTTCSCVCRWLAILDWGATVGKPPISPQIDYDIRPVYLLNAGSGIINFGAGSWRFIGT